MTAPARLEGLFGACFLFTGLGLIGHIVFTAPLWLTVLAAFAAAALFFAGLYLRTEFNGVDLRARVTAGVVAGVVGTVLYDLTRGGLWGAGVFEVWPFEAFRHFGRGLLGQGASDDAALAAGTAFHASNGVLFACAYVVAVKRPTLVTAIAWALTLETMTLLLYPDWLGIKKLGEFTQISLLGHVAYGIGISSVARRYVPREREAALT